MIFSRVTFGWEALYSCSFSAAEARRSWSFVFCSSERFRSPAKRLSSLLISSVCSALRFIVLLLIKQGLLFWLPFAVRPDCPLSGGATLAREEETKLHRQIHRCQR